MRSEDLEKFCLIRVSIRAGHLGGTLLSAGLFICYEKRIGQQIEASEPNGEKNGPRRVSCRVQQIKGSNLEKEEKVLQTTSSSWQSASRLGCWSGQFTRANSGGFALEKWRLVEKSGGKLAAFSCGQTHTPCCQAAAFGGSFQSGASGPVHRAPSGLLSDCPLAA